MTALLEYREPAAGSATGQPILAWIAAAGERFGRAMRRRGWRVLVSAVGVVILAVAITLVEPKLSAVGAALRRPRWAWLVLAVACQAASIVAFALLQRRMLQAGGVRVGRRAMTSVSMAANALNLTLPAGSVLSAGYTYRRMRRLGAGPAPAAWSLLAAGVLSSLTFATLGIIAVLANSSGAASTLTLALGLTSGATILALATLAMRHPQLLIRLALRALAQLNRARGRPPATGAGRVLGFAAQATSIRPTAADWLAGTLLAALNWITDLACLAFSCYAVGFNETDISILLAAYIAGMAVSSISLLPGGLASVEAAVILTLVHGGIAPPLAAAAVVLYRCISFLLVAAVGWLCWARNRHHDRSSAGVAQRATLIRYAGTLEDVAAATGAITLSPLRAPHRGRATMRSARP